MIQYKYEQSQNDIDYLGMLLFGKLYKPYLGLVGGGISRCFTTELEFQRECSAWIFTSKPGLCFGVLDRRGAII